MQIGYQQISVLEIISLENTNTTAAVVRDKHAVFFLLQTYKNCCKLYDQTLSENFASV